MRILYALLLSLILHVFMTWTFSLVPDQWAPISRIPKISRVDVQLISKTDDPMKQQIVRDTEIPEAQKAPEQKDPARFLSARTQRVWVETKAKKTGLTENRTLNQLKLQQEEAKAEKQRHKDEKNDEFALYKPVDFHKALRQVQDEGYSTTGEALPNDLAIGDFNALNTDQYQFYSFYSRVEELVRFRWETRVKSALEAYDRRNLLQRIGNKNWISKMTFFLSPEGRLQKIQVTQESGIPAFDQAAIGAFQEALIFPNPPQEMIKSDGLIHLQYSFNVHFNPQTLAF